MRPTASGGAMTLDTVRELWRRGLHTDMARAVMHPVLGHTLEQITDARYPLNAFHRLLYEPFEAARRANPFITFREFLETDIAKGLLRNLLGDDQYVLATERWGADYFAARGRVLETLRTEHPPIAQWMSWGHWGPGEISPEVYDGMPRLLPVDFPVRRIAKDGTVSWGYPRWDTGRMRFYQNTAYAELLRRLPEGSDIPLDLSGGKLLAGMAVDRDVASRPFAGMSKLRLSTWQVVQLYSTGRAPPWKAVLLESGEAAEKGFRISKGTAGRNADDARWELARRLGDMELADEATFAVALEKQGDAARLADRPRRADANPDHPVTQLSNAELVALARDLPGAPRIAVKVWEVEHQRAQRSIRSLERVLSALDQVVDTSLIRHLCGLCDPHNLRLVTPEGHAALDFHAWFVGHDNRFNPNGARVKRTDARRALPDDTVDHVPRDPLEETPEDLISPDSHDTSYDEHADVERGMNFAFGFSPYYLQPVAALLGDPKVLSALPAFERAQGVQVIGSYNHLAGCINAAMSSYGMDQALLLRLFVNGRPL
jgi:hypothetical protein